MPDPELVKDWRRQPPAASNLRQQLTQLGVIGLLIVLGLLLLLAIRPGTTPG